MRRVFLALLVLAFATALPAAPARAANTPNAVTWVVDQDLKTITATVRLTLYPACSPRMATSFRGFDAQGEMAGPCVITQAIVDDITNQVTSLWNTGHTYRCYLVIVKVEITVDPGGTRFATPADRVMIAIDQTATNVRAHVHGAPHQPGHTWNGNGVLDRFVPINSSDQPTTFAWPSDLGTGEPFSLYAHEVGHILGLDDAYEYVTDANGNRVRQLRAGAVDDLMASSHNTFIDQTTIDRLVERSGALPPSEVKCDYKIDTMISWYHFESLKCGGPIGDWDIHVSGVFNLGGGNLVLTGDGRVTLARAPASFTGPWGAQYAIRLEGVPAAIGGQDGTVIGTGELAQGQLALLATTAEGTFFAQTPALALGGAAGDPAKDLLLPVENGQFC
jgi:hypothetical protein